MLVCYLSKMHKSIFFGYVYVNAKVNNMTNILGKNVIVSLSIRLKYLREKTGTFVKIWKILVLRWAMVVLSIWALEPQCFNFSLPTFDVNLLKDCLRKIKMRVTEMVHILVNKDGSSIEYINFTLYLK